MIEKSINAGITHFFLPAIDSSYTGKMYQLEKQYPENIRLMTGLHPTHVKENYKEELKHVRLIICLKEQDTFNQQIY